MKSRFLSPVVINALLAALIAVFVTQNIARQCLNVNQQYSPD